MMYLHKRVLLMIHESVLVLIKTEKARYSEAAPLTTSSCEVCCVSLAQDFEAPLLFLKFVSSWPRSY
jgi:hypothetical protein